MPKSVSLCAMRWALLGLGALAIVVAFRFLLTDDPVVCRANFDAIEPGMSEKQVELILGRRFDRWGEGIAGMKEWTAFNSRITLYFDRDANVAHKQFATWKDDLRSFFKRMRI